MGIRRVFQTCNKFVMELRESARSDDEVDETEQSPDTLQSVSETLEIGGALTVKRRKFNELNPTVNSPIAAALSARTKRHGQHQMGHINKG